ncbi:MAG: recombinase family protein [Mycobacteriales bacterium]
MKPFAFYGRVSTEDQQDPQSSKGWQLSRSRTLIEPAGGTVVAEYFDIGRSRSLPWKRRPEAAALLAALARSDRGFDAVVIGEPARAFYGNQFGLTFPVFTHYGVELWVPEVGGRIDPGSDAHDLVMVLYGGMSKGERNRIKIRVRAAMAAQAATEGRFLGGRPPYGYALADAGAHPNPGKAAIGQRLHRLEPDPATAPIVGRIFAEYAEGKGLYAIAEGLTRDGIPSPSGYDRARNPHRCGIAWSKAAVRAILANPRYTGRQVWNRQRRDEVLIDVDDVALGHETRMRWNPEADWVYSAEPTHQPLVSAEVFGQVQAQLRQGARRAVERKPRVSTHPYALKSLIRCGVCTRRMEATWNNDRPFYRCRFPAEYALANRIEHPRNVYLREDAVLPQLDGWLASLFEPPHLEKTIDALASAAPDGSVRDEDAAEARRVLAETDAQLDRYRAALDAGADPAVVAGWIADAQARRTQAEQLLHRGHAPRRMTQDEIATLVRGLGNLLATVRAAHPADKGEIYRKLGIGLTYQPEDKLVVVEASPPGLWRNQSVGGGT